MNAIALGIFQDLRRRRLLPVAVLLLVALVALPVVALKPAAEAPPAPPAVPATTSTPAGLPSPEQALSDKPLVSLAVLDQPSDLGEFESKNPFKPIEQVSSGGAGAGGSDPTAPSGGGATLGGGAAGGGSTGGGSTGGGSTGGGSTGGSDQDKGSTPQPSPEQDPPATPPQVEKKLTYALDMTIRGPKGLRNYRGLPKLSLLPAQDNPLLVFLGIEDAGTKAVFLVDAKLRSQSGEGTCSPARDQCATLAMAPGEEHVLVNDAGQTWTLRIVEVRETSVAKAAAAARKAQKRRSREATISVGDKPAPRFIPPMITDLFTGGRS